MAVTTFIPELWARELLLKLRKTLIAAQPRIVNRDYQGEINGPGDTVHINSFGTITVFDYVKNADMPVAQELTTTEQLLQITQSKGFNFQLDDIDAAQANPGLMQAAMAEAAYALADVADKYLLATQRDAVPSANTLGTAAAPQNVDATNVYDLLVDLGVILSDNNVPSAGRFALVTPKFHGLLQKSDDFTKASDLGDDVVVNGRVGRAAGFDILETPNIVTIGTGGAGDLTRKGIVAGYNGATSYAEKINKVESYTPERRFGDALKGLHVYGAKVTRPEALAMILAESADV